MDNQNEEIFGFKVGKEMFLTFCLEMVRKAGDRTQQICGKILSELMWNLGRFYSKGDDDKAREDLKDSIADMYIALAMARMHFGIKEELDMAEAMERVAGLLEKDKEGKLWETEEK